MRKALSCVLMMTLLLCACTGERDDSPEQLAAAIRGEYLSLAAWRAEADVSVSYGDTVFEFSLSAAGERDGETVLTVTAPDTVAGITARVRKGETLLEYDGAGLSLGALDGSGLTPVSALPAVLQSLTEGYMARCAWQGEGEGRALLIQCRDPRAEEGKGTGFDLYLDPATHALLRAEVSADGVLVLTVRFHEFTMEMTNDGTGTDEDLGGDRPGRSGA